MKTFIDCNLAGPALEPVEAAIRARIKKPDIKSFLLGLLELSSENGDRGYSRDEIAGRVDPQRAETTSNKWANEKKLLDLFHVNRGYFSKTLEGKLLDLEITNSRPKLYRLGIIDDVEGSHYMLEGSVIRYRYESEGAQLSIIGRITFPGIGIHPTDYKRWFFIVPLVLMLLVLVTGLGFLTILGISGHFNTFSSLVSYVLICLICWMIWQFMRGKWGRFYDEKILLLEDYETAIGRSGLALDLDEQQSGRAPVLRRYVGLCPICQELSVSLSQGDAEFPKRLVGRCNNSRQEHVFSFDRVTLEGAPLRAKLASRSS